MPVAPASPRPGVGRHVAAVVGVGIVAGAVSGLLTWLLHATVWLALGPAALGLRPEGAATVALLRRLLAPTAGAAVVAAAWWWLRRRSHIVGVRAALRDDAPMPVAATLADAAVQVIGVGAGLSVGREGAPRQAAAAVADRLARRWNFAVTDRRRLVAAAAGAGLAGVYNVPLAGVAFVVEVLGVRAWWEALLASGIGTVTAWAFLGWHPVYDLHPVGFPWQGWVFAVLVAPVGWLLGRGFAWLANVARDRAPSPGPLQAAAIVGSGLLVGVVSCWLPEAVGNGKGLVELAVLGGGSVLVFAVASVVKPLLTSATLGASVAGGLLTPALATGATFGAACALLLGEPGSVAAFALLGAAAVLAASERAPVFAGLLTIELTRPPVPYIAAIALCAATALAWQQFLRRRT